MLHRVHRALPLLAQHHNIFLLKCAYTMVCCSRNGIIYTTLLGWHTYTPLYVCVCVPDVRDDARCQTNHLFLVYIVQIEIQISSICPAYRNPTLIFIFFKITLFRTSYIHGVFIYVTQNAATSIKLSWWDTLMVNDFPSRIIEICHKLCINRQFAMAQNPIDRLNARKCEHSISPTQSVLHYTHSRF